MSEQYSRRKKIVLTLLPVLIFVGILAGIEITVRLTKPHMSLLYYMYSLSSLAEQNSQDPNMGKVTEGDLVLGWKFLPNINNVIWEQIYLNTNSKGMRYDKEVGPKEPGTIRVAVYGDSVSFGWRTPMINTDEKALSVERKNTEKTYWMWLEEKLLTMYPDKNIEVMSFGVPGYSTYQGYEWMKRSIGWAQPDIVITQFGINDQMMTHNKIKIFNKDDKIALGNSSWAVTSKKVFSSSQAFMHFSHYLFKATPDQNYLTDRRVSQQDFVTNMLAMSKLVKDSGATPIVILPIYRDFHYDLGEYREALREALAQTDYLSIEIKELTGAGYPENLNLFLEAIHPNSDGYNLMATRTAELIQSKNLIEE